MPAMKRERLIILDALRAMAGLTVPLFHICENLGRSPFRYKSICSHGYLAVEFFLLLMGYMLAYAYDRRWSSGMGMGGFFRRRLVRLHPLVISGVLLGVAVACAQSAFGFSWMPWLQGKSAWHVALLALWAMTMVPVVGEGLINPFNACSWTLYYEYAGNILYALGLRRLGRRALAACVAVAAFFWLCFVLHVNLNGVFGTHLALFDKVAANDLWSIVCGWSDSASHCYGGFVRLSLPLFLGLLLARLGWRIQLKKGAFALAVAVFALVLFTPGAYWLGGEGRYWVNSLFEFMAVAVVFPLLILVGVGSQAELPPRVAAAVTYLAELSYPLYMSHFMFMGVFRTLTGRFARPESPLSVVLVGAATYLALIAIAALMMRFWDRPIQRFFSSRAK